MRMEKSMSFKEEQTNRVETIEKILKKYLPEQEGHQKVIMDAMEYSVMAGGKRLRPMLMQETYELFGGKEKVIEPFFALGISNDKRVFPSAIFSILICLL